MPVYLYLVRHGEPAIKNYKNYFPGPPLGENGKRQAKEIANILQDKNIQQIFASDFLRVQQTMAPFLQDVSGSPIYEEALREREREVETHESLVDRVQSWFVSQQKVILNCNTAIFCHCGPINMILKYLDPGKGKLEYPYRCPFGCLTPLGGLWELELTDSKLVSGQLITT